MVVLDTCAMIWLFEQQPMTPESLETIRRAAQADGVLVSPVSDWELGLLGSRRANRTRFQPSPWIWFDDVLGLAGVRLTALAPHAAIEAAFLPGGIHADPADRLLIATARDLQAPLVTRDARILAYAAKGHLDVVPC
jgi:PIN domain nuclease of toxin-antitoxin system